MKYLDNNTKIDLITLLTQSLKSISGRNITSAREFYGIWGDDGMSDEEFIAAIRDQRAFNQDIVEL